MSADNWTVCPKCKKGADDEANCTMREDWELGLDAEGLFSVNYHASCSVRHGGCGFKYHYHHVKNIEAGKDQA